MEHIDLGMNLVKQAINDLSGVGKADDTPKLNGRFIIVSLSPIPQHQRVLKYNTLDDIDVEEEDDAEEEDGEEFEEDEVAESSEKSG
jgi:hypothetical protein